MDGLPGSPTLCRTIKHNQCRKATRQLNADSGRGRQHRRERGRAGRDVRRLRAEPADEAVPRGKGDRREQREQQADRAHMGWPLPFTEKQYTAGDHQHRACERTDDRRRDHGGCQPASARATSSSRSWPQNRCLPPTIHVGTPNAPAAWAELLPEQVAGRVVVGIETDRGPWVTALRAAGYQVFAINPMSAARYRERHATSGAKSDAGDAHVLAEIVRLDRDHHRPVAGDSDVADAVKLLARAHQNAIWERTRHVLRLRSTLREFFPAALEAFGDLTASDTLVLLERAPSPELAAQVQEASPSDSSSPAMNCWAVRLSQVTGSFGYSSTIERTGGTPVRCACAA